MNIHIVEPCGFCHGVNRVIEKTREIIDDYPSSHIYMIGNVVHNDLVVKELTKHKNVKILKDGKLDRLTLVKSIKTKANVVIFSAHGSDPRAIDYAYEQGWKVFDLTCPFVTKILSEIQFAIRHGYHVAYYGIKDHPEAIAAKKVGGVNLTVYKTKNDLKQVLNMPKVFVTTQSTMSVEDFKLTTRWFSDAAIIKVKDLICPSSRKRQEEANELKDYDIIFVVSDKNSHNGLSLYKTLKAKHKHVMFIQPDKFKLTKKLLSNKKDCAIFSSSSVSKEQVNNFVSYLNKLVKC